MQSPVARQQVSSHRWVTGEVRFSGPLKHTDGGRLLPGGATEPHRRLALDLTNCTVAYNQLYRSPSPAVGCSVRSGVLYVRPGARPCTPPCPSALAACCSGPSLVIRAAWNTKPQQLPGPALQEPSSTRRL